MVVQTSAFAQACKHYFRTFLSSRAIILTDTSRPTPEGPQKHFQLSSSCAMPKIGIPTCEFAVARRDFAKLLCKPPFGSIDVKLNIDALLLPSGTLYTRIMPGDPDQPTTVTIRGKVTMAQAGT
ncbi:hypothetical protein L596_028344 [Steinernema carpocapsae]|uniref:Uncharacterized protein n=1 Tax=Steinernema carpocapsae TaxID=34508 RepID=A0A4U5LY74_STECR|nr:hypothetical protein L596_028344 [Steinernema carpocapsae]